MVNLQNVGTINVDTGFKVGYLNELEIILEKILPHAMLKAKPNLESRIRTLKRDWAIVFDMLSRKDNSGFGWDKHKQPVVVWNSYINRATGKYAQTTVDIVEEIDVEDVATTNIPKKRNNYHGCEADLSLDEMNVLATQSQPLRPNQDDSIFSKKKKKSDQISSTSLIKDATLLGENIWTAGLK
ncbi:L10-interacting MYB domain-containing protein-like [Gossypium australe]|uniref:L10-interacting MYB domain-containing protein-like n=1 Tax=Gossypium australe TaxID=47621 RepID=A0A5B6VC15_9ROSI|nr:L10-interacting MYB domain-containing protein-like [Gossypium australe]